MTFVYLATIGVLPGEQLALVELLTRPDEVLAELGCLRYEVGVNEADPLSVFVSEAWTSAQAHEASLNHPAVAEAIAAARPLLSGSFTATNFEVVGSPLHSER